MLDWLGRSLTVVAVLLLWLVPAGLLARGLRDDLFPDDGGLRFLVLAVPVVWLFFPVGLLSSLASESRWVIFRPVIVGRLFRLLPASATFYAVSAALAILAALPWYFALGRGRVWMIPVAAVVSAVLFLVYARLLGRVTYLISQLGPVGPLGGAAPDSAPPPAKKKGKKRARVEVRDPWAVPEEAEEEAETLTQTSQEDDGKPYGLGEGEPAKPPDVALLAGELPGERQRQQEERRAVARAVKRQVRQAKAKAKGPGWLFRGLVSFPFEGDTRRALAWLACGQAAVGVGIYVLLLFWPG
jgi:hypothetical protein